MIKQTPKEFPLRTVDIIVYPGFKALEAIGAMKVFDYANTHLRLRNLPGGYDVRIASTAIGPVASDTLMSLQASKALDAHRLPDLAVIVGCHHVEQVLQEIPALAAWVAEAAPRIDTLAALCTGCFFLAEAGVLDGKSAATHWSAVDSLRQRYPLIQVNADAIFVREGKFWTSAGVTAGIDLALSLLAEAGGVGGAQLALQVARRLVVYTQRQGGQSQFSPHLTPVVDAASPVAQAQQYVLAHLGETLDVATLARLVAMSPRNFARIFARELGVTPAHFIESARLDAARAMLAASDEPLKTIAWRCGFGTADQLRTVFLRRLGVSAKQYRQHFSPSR